ncbi:MAG: response regulator [Planctomycetes bacterium]|nr:response regulator [Planctomycetota bacterium]MBI3833219.1 response regulator [Planctomycetota bacterium]
MTTKSRTPLLSVVVVGESPHTDELVQWLDVNARAEHVHSVDEALNLVRHRAIDLVILPSSSLLPKSGEPSIEQTSAILLAMDSPGCVTDRFGQIEWSNEQFQKLPLEARTRASDFCIETAKGAGCEIDDESSAKKARVRHAHFRLSGDLHFDATATPIARGDGSASHVALVLRDMTFTGRMQDKLEAIDQAGRELLSLDAEQFSRLDPQERLSLIEQKLLRFTRDLLNFDHFEIRVLDRATNKLEVVLASAHTDCAELDVRAEADRNGISGYVAVKGRSYICPDVMRDARYLKGVDGAKSSLTVPMFLHDRVIGVANFESTTLAAFNEDDRQFAEIFCRYVALALHFLQLLANERQTTTCRVAKGMMGEITGSLNDISTEIESLVEDYIGHDDLRHRLRAVSDHVQKIRESAQEMASERPGVISARSTPSKRGDPVLDGRRILLADDEEIIRETVRDVLTGYGVEVSAVSDGEAAIELIRTTPSFDLVLSDIKMPLKSGYEVFAAAKQVNPATPVILTTGFGYDPNHSIIRARREGLSAVLFKPFKVDQLLTEIRTALKTVTTV